MKIKQIKKTDTELYLVTYSRCCRSDLQRYVIAYPQDESLVEMGHTKTYFYFRDSQNERAFDCVPQLDWMIRNGIDFFDNTRSPDPDWPRGDKHPICENCGKRHDLSDYCTSDKFSRKTGVPDKPTPPLEKP